MLADTPPSRMYPPRSTNGWRLDRGEGDEHGGAEQRHGIAAAVDDHPAERRQLLR